MVFGLSSPPFVILAGFLQRQFEFRARFIPDAPPTKNARVSPNPKKVSE